jgi:transcriptional regulator with XRE-family HTH domain
MSDVAQLGHQLRSLRAAAGRTVASVAADAGLSVPYIANLENGRGNPTLAALDRLATALEVRLDVALVPARDAPRGAAAASVPASLVRLGRTARFRQDVAALAQATGADPGELSILLTSALARLAAAVGVEPAESDWLRLLDAVLLTVLHPGGSA